MGYFCCCCCAASCWGGFCCESCGGYCCSECVGCATCNNQLCSTCLTGSCCGSTCFYAGAYAPPEIPCLGSDTPICLDAPCLGMPSYISCGPADCQSSLTATETAAYCSDTGNWVNMPCSPFRCGTTDQAPIGGGGGSAKGSAGSGGGSSGGGGSAKPAGGTPANKKCDAMSKLTQAMSKFGSSIASMMAGGQKVSAKNILPGQAAQASLLSNMTPNTFLLVILIVGGLLLMLSFGHKSGGD